MIPNSAPYCKPCWKSFQKFIDQFEHLPQVVQNTEIVFFYTESTVTEEIYKYESLVKREHPISFVKGNMKHIDQIFQYVNMPDGALFDGKGRFKSNHFTLANF